VKGRVTAATTTPVVISGYVPEGRSVIAGTGLTGGGTLTSNVTLAVNFASSDPQALGTATAGVSTAAARGDHVHPAVNLSDTSQTQGALPLGRGGTGDALSPVAGAVVYSTGTRFALTALGLPGQVLVSNGTSAPSWLTVSGVGTVTSVNVSGGTTGLTFTGGPVTAAGTITAGGTLGVANGGTGTGTAFTSGSLVFAGAAGVYAQDNANLFWDDTNNRLGVGTASPAARLTVRDGNITSILATYGASARYGFGNPARTDDAAYIEYAGAGDFTGSLIFATNGVTSNVAATEKMRITGAGNVGIGVTPSLWNSSYRALEIGNTVGLTRGGAAEMDLLWNAFVNPSAQYVYRITAAASRYQQTTGEHIWSTAVSGTAGATISFSERMRINNAGDVGIGTTAPLGKLDARGSVKIGPSGSGAFPAGTLLYLDDFVSGGTARNITWNLVTTNTDSAQISALREGASYATSLIFKTANSADAFSTERMRINSSGNVGIGTIAPQAQFTVGAGNMALSTLGVGLTGSTPATGTQKLILGGNSGNGVGNAIGWYPNTSFSGDIAQVTAIATAFGVSSAGALVFRTNSASETTPSERARIDASGNLLLGRTATINNERLTVSQSTANPAATLFVTATSLSTPVLRLIKADNDATTSQVFVQFFMNNNSTPQGQINANGASQAAFGSFSDSRLKDNISNLPPQLGNIISLRPVEFDYKDGSGHQIGFVAQEIQQVYPDAVSEDSSEDHYLVVTGWSKTEARLVKAIQEQQEIIQQLAARVAQLEGN
jgi:hypothetical protein